MLRQITIVCRAIVRQCLFHIQQYRFKQRPSICYSQVSISELSGALNQLLVDEPDDQSQFSPVFGYSETVNEFGLEGFLVQREHPRKRSADDQNPTIIKEDCLMPCARPIHIAGPRKLTG